MIQKFLKKSISEFDLKSIDELIISFISSVLVLFMVQFVFPASAERNENLINIIEVTLYSITLNQTFLCLCSFKYCGGKKPICFNTELPLGYVTV